MILEIFYVIYFIIAMMALFALSQVSSNASSYYSYKPSNSYSYSYSSYKYNSSSYSSMNYASMSKSFDSSASNLKYVAIGMIVAYIPRMFYMVKLCGYNCCGGKTKDTSNDRE